MQIADSSMQKLALYVTVVFCFFLLTNCKNQEQFVDPVMSVSDKVSFNEQLVIGLASPIQLTYGNTEVILKDYLDKHNGDVTGVQCPDNFNCQLNSEKGTVDIVYTGKGPKAGSMQLITPSGRADLFIKASDKAKVVFTYHADTAYASVAIFGEMNAWNPANNPLVKKGYAWSTEFYLRPGDYAYQLEIDGERRTDDNNKSRKSNGQGGFNSILTVKSESSQSAPKIWSESVVNNGIKIHVTSSSAVLFAYYDNVLIETIQGSGSNEKIIIIPETAKQKKRSHIRVWAASEGGISNDLLIPLQYGKVIESAEQLSREDAHTQSMYFLMMDRFNNANPLNDAPENNPEILPIADFKGGDIAGVTKSLNAGYFSELGINTIWLSPIMQNPKGAFGLWNKGGVTSRFSAYHGYWPISFTQIDERFGTEDDLKELVTEAHQDDVNIILDVVANHVHELHPVYQANKHKNWATELHLPDGSLNTERWDEHRLTTWFDVFLPTLNLENQEVTEMLSDSVASHLDRFNLDGFRHDATKHIPENFWRTLTAKVKDYSRQSGKSIYQVGETYGTPELISSYISSGMLDGQFDFNVYDAITQSLISDERDFTDIKNRLEQSCDYYGYHHLMGNMSGNQDKPRLMALMTGDVSLSEDTKLAGWTRNIEQKTEAGFKKVEMVHAINFMIPGVPCIYYGDEIGMTGGNDPDNRKVMQFTNLSDQSTALKENVARLAHLRSSSMPLLYGDLNVATPLGKVLILERNYLTDGIIAVYNKSSEPKKVNWVLNERSIVSTFNHIPYVLEAGEISLTIPPYSYEIFQMKKSK